MGTRNSINFIPHLKFKNTEMMIPDHIDNFVFLAKKDEDKWIERSCEKIGEWRSVFRSTYIRWALCINGLCVASDKYADPTWNSKNKFTVSTLRAGKYCVEQANIVVWDGITASKAHKDTVDIIAEWGMIDLYGCIEEFVFNLYSIYLDYHPNILMEGSEFKKLRRIYNQREEGEAERILWNDAWKERIEKWHRKKLYDGIDKIFLSYCNHSRIKEPSKYTHTTIQTWAETIKGISILRNCLIHGVEVVPKELEEFCQKPYCMSFDFKEGQTLKVKLHHLQSVEMFTDQLLNALNTSFLELMYPEFKEIIKKI
ncbi:hypothetical protein KPL37_16715 [Clostridium frigoris]|uniref:Apea-like HEPN domain-containing protein n=1 Tax=Clostridium frigoris TaxID=205327 RepID=A0ABS6BXL7_9CLOT|nr:hypothetical protein [Clostridium frigoris]MBU3161352.1 hypothetical protein [Clostridium frigoris]